MKNFVKKYFKKIRLKAKKFICKIKSNIDEVNPKFDLSEFETISKINNSNLSRNDVYSIYHSKFKSLPSEICRHRRFFTKNKWGFGENAFHTFWWFLLSEFNPKKCLEIGVHKGQIISLWSLISKVQNKEINVTGLGPFCAVEDEVSIYEKTDYMNDIICAFNEFKLVKPELYKGLSNDEKAIEFIRSSVWDLIYIDGGHDYETVLKDWQVSSKSIAVGGVIVFDDSSLDFDYNPPIYAFAGHEGPSRLCREIISNRSSQFDYYGSCGHLNAFIKNA